MAQTGIDNAQRLREGYDAFDRGDMDFLRSRFHPDIVWHIPGKSPLAGDYRGIDAVFGFFMKVFEETGGTLKNEVHDILANDTHSIALVSQSATRNGKTLTANAVQVLHTDKEGLATESWFIPVDQYEGDEFWA